MSETQLVEDRAASSDLHFQVSRVIQADRARVFAAWTRPELMGHWFGSANFKTVAAQIDLREGGAYRLDLQGARCDIPGEVDVVHRVILSGVYEKIVPDELLSFSWNSDRIPAEKTVVTVEFRDVENGTEVTVTHEGFLNADSEKRHRAGWDGGLDRLVAFLEN